MKRFIKLFAVVVAMFAAVSVSAQDDPSKETVIVEPFTQVGERTVALANLRSAVMSGFSEVGRFYVVDALTDSRLSTLFAERDYEDVVTEDNWQSESTAVYKSLNAKYLLKGQLELLSLYSKLDDDGDRNYYCDVNYTLQVFNIADGTMSGSETYQFHELSVTSSDDAFNAICRKVIKDMTQFCNKYFKMESYVLELGEADKKGAIADLWIAGGTEMGISNGTIFKVLVEKKIGPKVTRSQIGQVIAKEVSDGVTRCEIMNKKEGEVIKQAFNDGQTLYVELDRKRGDGLKDVGRMFGF